jgi:pilus assembly protein CpaB
MLGLVASIVLALFGAVVLVGYVHSAADTAAAGEPTTAVLVVKQRVAKGTPAAKLDGLVEVRQVPKSTKAEGALESVAALEGQVAAVELLPGEQVLPQRFTTAEKLGWAGVPDGLLEVTVALEPQRAVGGQLKPGDTVGVVASFDPMKRDDAGLPPVPPPEAQSLPYGTHLILHRVLVSNVQTKATSAAKPKKTDGADSAESDAPKPAPDGQVLVTLAVDASAVERIVFAAEYGHLWLSAEPADAPDGGTQIETRGIALR